MAILDITDENFRQTYTNNEIVVLDFWAPWCGPCHQYAPVYEAVSELFPNIIFGKVNTEEEQKLAQYFGVKSIPTTIILRQELELVRTPGVMTENELQQIITQVKNADMEEVKKQIEAEES